MSMIGGVFSNIANWAQSIADDAEAKEIQKKGDKIEDKREKNHEQQDDIDAQIEELKQQKKDLQAEDEEMEAQQDEMGYTDENRQNREDSKNGKSTNRGADKQQETEASTELGDEEFDENTIAEESKTLSKESTAVAQPASVNINIGTGAGAGTPSLANTAQEMANTGLMAENPAAAMGFAAGSWMSGKNEASAGLGFDDDSIYANLDSDYSETSQREMAGGQVDPHSGDHVSHQQLLDEEAQTKSRGDMASEKFGNIEENFEAAEESYEY